MSTSWQCRLIASAILGAGLFALAACSVISEPSDPASVEQPSTDDPEESGGSSEEPTEPAEPASPADPAPVATQLPDGCGALLTAESLGGGLQPFHELATGWATTMLGPHTFDTVMESDQPLVCGWGMPQSDVITVVTASIISEPAKRALMKAFEGSVYADVSAKYNKLGLDTDVAYERPPSQDLQYVTTVLLDGPVLVAVGQTTNGNFAADALRSVQQLNAE